MTQFDQREQCDDETIESHSFAKDDRYQVLGLDPWSLDPTTNDGGPSGVDAHGGAHHREGDCQAHPNACPHVGRSLTQKPSNINPFTTSREHIVKNYDC